MLVISKLMYESIYGPHGSLKISGYEAANHLSSHYYFRLGAKRQGREVVPIDGNGLSIAPHSLMQVWSLEGFVLSERVLGLFGSLSALFDRGLQLLNSPFIDPTFNGALSLTISNLSGQEQVVHAGDRIGKILFFDVADTFFEPQEFLNNLNRKDLVERHEAAKALLDIATGLVQPWVNTIRDPPSR